MLLLESVAGSCCVLYLYYSDNSIWIVKELYIKSPFLIICCFFKCVCIKKKPTTTLVWKEYKITRKPGNETKLPFFYYPCHSMKWSWDTSLCSFLCKVYNIIFEFPACCWLQGISIPRYLIYILRSLLSFSLYSQCEAPEFFRYWT